MDTIELAEQAMAVVLNYDDAAFPGVEVIPAEAAGWSGRRR
jgi:hypothetical protein